MSYKTTFSTHKGDQFHYRFTFTTGMLTFVLYSVKHYDHIKYSLLKLAYLLTLAHTPSCNDNTQGIVIVKFVLPNCSPDYTLSNSISLVKISKKLEAQDDFFVGTDRFDKLYTNPFPIDNLSLF